ncbi:MAG: PASTA domain-containing protein [Clostridia bacterium]|nr:PASTA domain-containing protein [Clostridia bacterium]
MKKKKRASMKKRIVWLMVLLLLLGFIPITGQVVNVGIRQHETLQSDAVEQQTRNTVISPQRGTIYDTNMKPLAESATVETCYLSPLTIPEEQKRQVAQGLSQILGVDYNKTYEQTLKTNQYEVVKKKLEKEDADAVRAFISENEIEGVHLAEDTKRYYPYGDFLGQVLGFTGTDNQGLYGLELQYNDVLTGTKGRVVTAKDAAGNALPFQYEDYETAQSGTSIVLTIDEVIQHVAEKYLSAAVAENAVADRGVAIVIDVETGGVLACAVEPAFDPNNPYVLDPTTQLRIDSIVDENAREEARNEALQYMWSNKAVTDTYYPGSVFKIFTAAMGLEEGVVKTTDTFYCSGVMQVEEWAIHCHVRRGHGQETFVKGVLNSCNPVFMTVAQRLGADTFYKYMDAFGFLEKTGIDLPGEAVGIFHTKQNFNIVELSTAGFGQNFSVTPMQMAAGIADVANGGKLMQPYVVRQYVDNEQNVIKTIAPVEKRQIISKSTSDTLSEILELVVTQGTGSNAYAKGYRVAGKTGTTEKIDKQNKTGLDNLRIASFGAYAPANDPKIAVLVLLDEPGGPKVYGGQIAAPVVSKIIEESLPYLGVEPQYTESELRTLDITVPNLIDGFASAADAKAYLSENGIKCRVIGNGDTVTNQMPRPNTRMPQDGTIVIYTNGEAAMNEVEVPNVLGYSPQNVNAMITNRTLNFSATGVYNKAGVVAVSQSPVAGTVVPLGTTVSVEFREPNSTVE